MSKNIYPVGTQVWFLQGEHGIKTVGTVVLDLGGDVLIGVGCAEYMIERKYIDEKEENLVLVSDGRHFVIDGNVY